MNRPNSAEMTIELNPISRSANLLCQGEAGAVGVMRCVPYSAAVLRFMPSF